ncbi:uncharacterized protein FRV6_11465 [Fusarium oxysporum]|uniref:Uncharacterized protein n=1 Tax=Fusarium oxysporum TaxID=5507 RepID=A0A2H3TF65_FUSOX|nr:uncharacterized protein FRV6_11465 [Fusarium oxysporum]
MTIFRAPLSVSNLVPVFVLITFKGIEVDELAQI